MLATLSLDTRRDCALLDALGAGVLAVGQDGRIVAANVAACRIFGAERERLLGANVARFMAPVAELSARGRGEVSSAGDNGRVYGYTVTRYADPQLGVAFAVHFQEISSVLELRTQRDRLLQMAALGDALPCILHELKNPLAALSTMLEVMLEEPQLVDEREIHLLLTEVRRIHLTLQGVGGFAAPVRTGRYEAIDHAVQEACRLLEPTAGRRGITLRCEGAALPLLPLDRNVVSGVVFNLVRNAIDACAEGNTIVVSARLEDDGASFALAVSDDGPGMDRDVADRCTELFYTSKPTGSGIGLALCKQVALGAGGTLAIDSTLGAGTRVTLQLPVTRPTGRSAV